MYALFHRDETKPTHIIGISSFLFWMQLVYKRASPNYQHMTSHGELINKMLVYMCVRKLKHFQPHSLLCHLWCTLHAISSLLYDAVYDRSESWRSSFDELSFFIIYNWFHIATRLHRHSHTSRTIASSQHHPRETRPLLCQPNLYNNRITGISYEAFASHVTRKTLHEKYSSLRSQLHIGYGDDQT
jgi:hypothetical protein